MQLPLVWMAVHLDLGEFRKNVRNLLEFGPVVLDVLTGREMPVAAIIAARDASPGRAAVCDDSSPYGNGDPQHRRMSLDVQAVAQSQVAEFVLAQGARQEAAAFGREIAPRARCTRVLSVRS